MRSILIILVLFYLLVPYTAYAYLDPGTGSFVIQALIGALVAGAAVIGMFRHRIKLYFADVLARRRRRGKGGRE